MKIMSFLSLSHPPNHPVDSPIIRYNQEGESTGLGGRERGKTEVLLDLPGGESPAWRGVPRSGGVSPSASQPTLINNIIWWPLRPGVEPPQLYSWAPPEKQP